MANGLFDSDFPIFRSAAEIEAFFLRAKPFVEHSPDAAVLSLGPDLTRIGSFEALATLTGEQGAIAEIAAEAAREARWASVEQPDMLVFPNGWAALIQHPEAAPPDLRIAICPFETSSATSDRVGASVAQILLGLRDLSGSKAKSVPLSPRSDRAEAFPELLDRDRLEKAYKDLLSAREQSGDEQPRRARSSVVDGYLRWLSANMPKRAPEVRAAQQARSSIARSSRGPVDLKLHVLNMRFGELSQDGQFQTTPSDVSEIAREAAAWIGARAGRRLAIYAHGGLVGEADAIEYAQATARWWLENEVYPIFCVWESDALTTFLQLVSETLGGRRGRAFRLDEVWDAAVEAVVHTPLGINIWSTMKHGAKLASADGDQHGLTLLVKELKRAFGAVSPSLHLLGHSAGAIMMLHFLPRLKEAGLQAQTFQTLAPAATNSLYRQGLSAYGPSDLACRIYTMTDANERNDTAGPYRKSMLYLVSRGFERDRNEPISGLQKDLLADRSLIELVSAGLGGVTREALVFSETPAGTPRRLRSLALRHSHFNDERATMWSVMHFIRGPGEAELITEFPQEDARGRSVDLDTAIEGLPEEVQIYFALLNAGGGGAAAEVPAETASTIPAQPRISARRGLTIGIDEYGPGTSLRGCVNDSNLWRDLLAQRGFEVEQHVRPEQTGREQILRLLRDFVGQSAPGDTLVWHYSGHGVEVEPDPGPGDDEPTGFDQAIVGSTRATDMDGILAGAVIDDEIHQVLRGLHAEAELYVFLDSCFSGSATRLALAGTPRMLPSVRRRGYVPKMRSLTAPQVAGARGPYDGSNHVLFSAASATQVALENGVPSNGVFTRAVEQLLRNPRAPLTNTDFRIRVSDLILAGDPGIDQTPGLFCDPSRRNEPFPLL